MKIKDAQRLVKDFAKRNRWKDEPNIDKFDHVHEELIEMSRLLRYKTGSERKTTARRHKTDFEDGIGDLIFSTLRLANQLGVDAERAFAKSSKEISRKYNKPGREHKIIRK